MNPLVTAEFESNKKAVDESYIVPSKIDSAKTEISDQSGSLTGESEQTVSGLSEQKVPEAEKLSVQTAKAEIEKPAPEVIVPAVSHSGASYFIITGSFKSRKNALYQYDRLREEGFEPEIVTADNGFFRVCALSCDNLKTAVSRKDSIVSKFPGSWVSRNK
jgi:cell division protein FtsN